MRPAEVVFEFEQIDRGCIPPIDRSGTLSATLEWTSGSVEVHPVASTDPSLQDVTWSVELNPVTLSARLDDAGNVVEVFPAARSNLRELGIRQLEPSLVGVYTFEGEGDCARGTNPHLLVSTHGVLPYEYSPESCSTGQVTVTGYQQVCEDYGPDE